MVVEGQIKCILSSIIENATNVTCYDMKWYDMIIYISYYNSSRCPPTVPVARFNASEIVKHRCVCTTGTRSIGSSAGCRDNSAGIYGWHIPGLLRDQYRTGVYEHWYCCLRPLFVPPLSCPLAREPMARKTSIIKTVQDVGITAPSYRCYGGNRHYSAH